MWDHLAPGYRQVLRMTVIHSIDIYSASVMCWVLEISEEKETNTVPALNGAHSLLGGEVFRGGRDG